MTAATAYADCMAAVEAMWTANWAAPAGTSPTVVWHRKGAEATPSAASVDLWVHLAVVFSAHHPEAFGGGYGANEWALGGFVRVGAFAKRGLGEAALLSVLGAAVHAFRGRRASGLTFHSTQVMPAGGATADGAWWERSATASFVFRFQA